MKALRTIASALCIVLGAVLIAAWGASTAALSAIEDSTVIEDLTAEAITTDLAQEALVEQGTAVVLAALEDAGFNTSIIGFESLISRLVDGVVSSDAFLTLVHTQTKSVREQVVAALNAGGEGPITVTLDVSDQVNAKLGEIPVVGPVIPTIAVPGVQVQVMDAQAADLARATWGWLTFAAQWFGWMGLALLGAGIAVSSRKRWFFAKVAIALAVASGLIWLVATGLDPSQIAVRLPGGGVADAIIIELTRQAAQSVAKVMGFVALGAIIVAVVLGVLASRQPKGEPA